MKKMVFAIVDDHDKIVVDCAGIDVSNLHGRLDALNILRAAESVFIDSLLSVEKERQQDEVVEKD